MVMKTPPKTYGTQQKREVYSSTFPPKQKNKKSLEQINLTLHWKQLEKEVEAKPKVSKREKKNHKEQSRNKCNKRENSRED